MVAWQQPRWEFTSCLVFLAVAVAADSGDASIAQLALPPCPVESPPPRSSSGRGSREVSFKNTLPVDAFIFWVTPNNNEEVNTGMLPANGNTRHDSFEGHMFRIRLEDGRLLHQVVLQSAPETTFVEVKPCGDMNASMNVPLYGEGRDKEFEGLAHALEAPCLPEGSSRLWSCVQYLTREQALERLRRNASDFGFQEGEVEKQRLGNTFDKGYTRQIPSIPKVTPSGPGYLKMTMTSKLKALLLDWFDGIKKTSTIPEGIIEGGYTNNHIVHFKMVDLDKFPEVHTAIIREMQQVLQWWTKLRLKHTSTFGVRIYTRGSMLVDHVDRSDTHLASAVLQVAQSVDEDGGWPLELLLPNGRLGEVYLQPGEMVLYEGAWLRHGRPMRLKGDEFANVFSHFAPVDWDGPSAGRSDFYGYARGRCNTLADEDPEAKCVVDGKWASNEVDLGAPNIASCTGGEAIADDGECPAGTAAVESS